MVNRLELEYCRSFWR